MDWVDLLWIRVRDFAIEAHVSFVVVLLAIAVGAGGFLFSRRDSTWRLTRANFAFAGCGQVEICPNNEVARIAHQAWVELKTRKAAIPIDPEHDVIVEVYDSWYQLFGALRDLTRSIPPETVRAVGDAPVLADVLMRSLNEGLRPHLTRWQARFRKWYETEAVSPRTVGETPQEIQRRFPDYEDLVSDMLRVNSSLVVFAEELRKLAHERRRSFSLRSLFRKRMPLSP